MIERYRSALARIFADCARSREHRLFLIFNGRAGLDEAGRERGADAETVRIVLRNVTDVVVTNDAHRRRLGAHENR